MLEICIRTDTIVKYFVNSANKNGVLLDIFRLIRMKLHRIHGKIVVNACVKNKEKIFIGDGDIYPDGQISGRPDGRTEAWTAPQRDRAQIIIPHKFFWWKIILHIYTIITLFL